MMLSKSLKYKLVKYLLYMITVIGVLGAIWLSLPPFIVSTSRADQYKAKTAMHSISKSVKALYPDKKYSQMRLAIWKLQKVQATQNTSYDFTIKIEDIADTSESNVVFSYANSKHVAMRSYIGAVFRVQTQKDEVSSLGIICEANRAGRFQLPDPFLKDGVPTCPLDSQHIGN